MSTFQRSSLGLATVTMPRSRSFYGSGRKNVEECQWCAERFDGSFPPSRGISSALCNLEQWQISFGQTQATKSFRPLSRFSERITGQPAPGLKTYIAEPDFLVWLPLCCRIPVFESGTAYPHRGWSQELDRYRFASEGPSERGATTPRSVSSRLTSSPLHVPPLSSPR